jgi:hypothetical protein
MSQETPNNNQEQNVPKKPYVPDPKVSPERPYNPDMDTSHEGPESLGKTDQFGKKKSDTISFRSMRSEKKESASYDAILDYIKGNTKDSIAYVLMVIGLLLMLFGSYYGSFLIGLIFSLYFVNEIAFAVTHAKEFIEEYGLVKSLVLAGTLLGIFFKVPFLFVGIAIVIGIRVFLWPEDKKSI